MSNVSNKGLTNCVACIKLRRQATRQLLNRFIEELENLDAVLQRQNRISLYASSILIAYDTKKLGSLCLCKSHVAPFHVANPGKLKVKNSHQCLVSRPVDSVKKKSNMMVTSEVEINQTMSIPYNVRMIDFGHTFIDLFPGRKDENYLFGLGNLTNYFRKVLNEI